MLKYCCEKTCKQIKKLKEVTAENEHSKLSFAIEEIKPRSVDKKGKNAH